MELLFIDCCDEVVYVPLEIDTSDISWDVRRDTGTGGSSTVASSSCFG